MRVQILPLAQDKGGGENMDQSFLIRLFVTIGIVWLAQVVLETLSIKEPARKLIFLAVVVVGIIFIVAPSVLPNLIK